MYMCKDCGASFDEPYEWYDDPSPAGVSLSSGCYAYQECPECGSDYIEEANTCKRCGEAYLGVKVLCDDCLEELGMELREIKEKFQLDQHDFEQAICDYFDW